METVSLISEYQIEPYRGSTEKLHQTAVMFSGSPQTSNTPGKIMLLNDPGSTQAFFYEFRLADILYGEEATSLSLPDGSNVHMVRLWVKKDSTALKIVPFHVQDTAQGLKDFFTE